MNRTNPKKRSAVVRIYDHPLDNDITVVEIERVDEKTAYLESVLDGFHQCGMTYPSSSYGTDGKRVIYLDGRIRENFWCTDTEILVLLAAQLGTLNAQQLDSDPWSETLKLVKNSGESDILDVLNIRGSDYFQVFKTTYHIDQ